MGLLLQFNMRARYRCRCTRHNLKIQGAWPTENTICYTYIRIQCIEKNCSNTFHFRRRQLHFNIVFVYIFNAKLHAMPFVVAITDSICNMVSVFYYSFCDQKKRGKKLCELRWCVWRSHATCRKLCRRTHSIKRSEITHRAYVWRMVI